MSLFIYICFSSVAQILKLQNNRIAKLTNSSFAIYPKIKELLLSGNVVHTIESGSLTALDELEVLDLSDNALQEAPVGLPASLVHLNLNKNPLKHTERLSRAVGLQVLRLSRCDLPGYPALGLMPNLVELDVSDNEALADLDPVQLAATCRLTRLDVTGCAELFRVPSSRCRCLRAVEWTRTYKIRVVGMPSCPDADDATAAAAEADNCTAAMDDARAVFKNCMAEWEHRNTPYWAIGLGLVIAVAVLLALCVCVRRRRRGRGRTDKVPAVPATAAADTKANIMDSTAADNKSDPAALLSSP